MSLRLELDDDALEQIAENLAERLRAQPEGITSPWMNFEALCEYTQIPEGTLRKLTAAGTVPGHSSGRAKIYHRDEVDEALLGYSRKTGSPQLRRVS